MEFIIIDMKTFRKMLKRMEELKQKIEEFNNKVKPPKMGEWIDAEIVCRMLNISRRTLQEYRTEGVIPYYRINGKILYRESDIEKLLQDNYIARLENGFWRNLI